MSDYKLAIVVSRFNRSVTDALLEGAFEAVAARDVACSPEHDVFPVPGAFEIPLVAARLARSGRYDGIACLGAVIRGETPHFEYICQETAAGLQSIALETEVPVAFGVLTTDNADQALARAGGGVGNKGYEAVVTIVETLDVLRRVPMA